MVRGRNIFLGFSALAWLPYGLFCFLRPGYLAEAAGVAATTVTGTVELQAMYGGLQIALGVLALVGLLRPRVGDHALAALAFVCGGLGLSRFLGTIAAHELSAYTAVALVFEWTSAAFAVWLLSRGTGHALENGSKS